MAVQLNVASGNENTQGLWRGTVPDGSPKHRGSLGNGKFADDLSRRFHVMDSVLGEDKEVQQCSTKVFFISPKTPETGTTCSIVLGVFLPKMCEGSSGNDGV